MPPTFSGVAKRLYNPELLPLFRMYIVAGWFLVVMPNGHILHVPVNISSEPVFILNVPVLPGNDTKKMHLNK